jgi:hypothetical protein
MTQEQAVALKASLREAFEQTIQEIGVEAFKATSWFGSNAPASHSQTAGWKLAA